MKSFRFDQLLLLAVVCMVVNRFNVVMAIQNNRTSEMPSLVLIDQQQQNGHHETTVNVTTIRGYFWDFVKYFGIELSLADVDIQIIDGLSALVEFLNKPKYSTIIYVLQGQGSKDFGYCEMSKQLKNAFNKTVLFWPCPEMKATTERYLPSYETISYAVKSISMKFNWTEATIFATDCLNCIDESVVGNRWTMPLHKIGDKKYYLGTFFKANWFKASQYCRFHSMHLASISSQEDNDRLEKHIKDYGYANDHFWTSGTDLADEGNFFWMANGKPITFTNWNAGEPNNFRYENGEEENCLELWNRDGKGLKWNDSPCSFETYFICET